MGYNELVRWGLSHCCSSHGLCREYRVDSGAHITLLVNNASPHIKLTPEWWIWQSGNLVIKTEYFPVRDGMIVIADNDGRWPEVKVPFGEKYPPEIKWDRRFANGVLAPSGDYQVRVTACNIHDLCSERSATIKIPWYAQVVPTASILTMTVDVEQESQPQMEHPISTPVPSVVDVIVPEIEMEASPKVENEGVPSLLSFIILITLMLAISAAAMADKRPAAIRAIARTLSSQKNMENKKYLVTRQFD